MKDLLVYFVVRIFVCFIQALRMESCHRVAVILTAVCCDLFKIRGSVVDENLRHAFPRMSAAQRQQLARKMWEHLFLMIAEIAHAPRKIHHTNWRKYMTVTNKRALVAALLDERPNVLVSAHFGNFEIAGYTLGLLGLPTFTVARPLDNPHLDRFLNRFRGQTGQRMLPKQGSADDISQLLRCNGALLLLGDQYAGHKGCRIEFFGRDASVHKAIAVFAIGNQAPLAVCFGRRLGKPMRFEIGMQAILDPQGDCQEADGLQSITQWFTGHLEQAIRRSPDQYWWVHRRWRDPRPQIRAQRKARKAAA